MPDYRVLSVDDDVQNYLLLRIILRDFPFEFFNAATGAEAIEFLTREAPALIILDLELPDMFGWQILERFKNDPRFENSTVIVLTSHTEPVNRLIGNLLPVTAYLSKPVKTDELRRIIQQCLKL